MGKNKYVKMEYMKKVFCVILCIICMHIFSIGVCYSTTISEVLPDKILTDFRAKSVYELHPRLFYTEKTVHDLQILKQKGDEFVLMHYENSKQEADKILSSPLLNYFLDEAGLRIPSIHKFAVQVPNLIFMYQMTGEEKYAKRVIEQCKVIADYPDWGDERHFLDTGIGAYVFAFVYDGLYNYLTNDDKDMIRKALLEKALIPGKKQIEGNEKVWKWYKANNNWNGICNGGLITAALAIFETNPEFCSELISGAVNNLPLYLREFEPDGQSEEGLMYWSYGLMYTVLALQSMENTLGTTYGMTSFSGIKKAGWFPFLMSGPVVSINIGDDPLRKGRDASLLWFADYYNDYSLAKRHIDLCLKKKSSHWEDVYFYKPAMREGDIPVSMSLNNYLHGIELFSLRENWNSEEAMYIAMHGGANNANHGHLDAGSFYLQALGEVFADGDLGRDDYTFPGYFSKKTIPDYWDELSEQKEPGRWHFYRLRTEGKNCVVINPDIRPEQNEKGKAVLKRSFSDSLKCGYTVDLSDCYLRDASYYTRTIEMDKSESSMYVVDSMVCRNEKSDAYWFMHTRADIQLSKNSKKAILDIKGKKLLAEILSPKDALFSVMNAESLFKDNLPFTRNTNNNEFKKLCIQLSDIKNTNIKVRFKVVKNVRK